MLAYGISMLVCWAWLIVILSLPRRDPSHSILPVMWMLYTYISIYISKGVYCIFSILGRALHRYDRLRRNHGIGIGIGVSVLIFSAFWWGAFFVRRDIEVNTVTRSYSRLPESFSGFKVVQFSDAHVGTWGTDTMFLSRFVDCINEQKPDLILFTGDIVNAKSSELDPFTNVLGRLSAPYGVFAVHGNHDYGHYTDWSNPGDADRDVARLDSLMESMGWKVLNNSLEYIVRGNDSIALLGVENWGEPPFDQKGRLDVIYSGKPDTGRHLNDDMFKILMTHNPEHWNQVVTKSSNVDLTLSGHTHAMQFELRAGKRRWSPSAFRYRNWGGLYSATSRDSVPMDLYVNIGCGEVGFPARIGSAYPEITLFTLKQ